MPYAVSEHTKTMLCQALKKKMAQKPLDKITIRELADDCGLKRQAFYYHFEDIYDLVRWMMAWMSSRKNMLMYDRPRDCSAQRHTARFSSK